jgi:hypothetical protein
MFAADALVYHLQLAIAAVVKKRLSKKNHQTPA